MREIGRPRLGLALLATYAAIALVGGMIVEAKFNDATKQRIEEYNSLLEQRSKAASVAISRDSGSRSFFIDPEYRRLEELLDELYKEHKKTPAFPINPSQFRGGAIKIGIVFSLFYFVFLLLTYLNS